MENNKTRLFREYLPYKGKYYKKRTAIALSDDYMHSHSSNGKKIWKYARFSNYVSGNDTYFFDRAKYSWYDLRELGYTDEDERRKCQTDFAPYFTVHSSELAAAIEEIYDPVELSEEEIQAILQKDQVERDNLKKQYPAIMIFLWIIYITILFFSLIFTEFYLIWIIASFAFWRIYKALKDELS